MTALALVSSYCSASSRPMRCRSRSSSACGIFQAYFGLTDVLSQPVTDENFSVVERIAHWVAAQRMWAQSPWFGVGPGNYAVVIRPSACRSGKGARPRPQHVPECAG